MLLLVLLPPLLWDGGEVPPPAKLPCLDSDKNLGTLQNMKCQSKKTLEDKTEIMADCSATQPAPFSLLLVG